MGEAKRRKKLDPNYGKPGQNKKHIQLLEKILKLIAKPEKSDKIHQLLQSNLAQLNDFEHFFAAWVSDKLLKNKVLEPSYDLAKNILDFCIFIDNFNLGDKSTNIKIALAGLEVISQVFDPELLPEEWAQSHSLKGLLYLEQHKRENQPEKLGIAKQSLNEALQVYTLDKYPLNWASCMKALGDIYKECCYYSQGNQAENIELAVECYKKSLIIFNFETFPQLWSLTNLSLGSAYSMRLHGHRGENSELTITCCMNALKYLTSNRYRFPQEWIALQMNLGTAYRTRVQGDKKENIKLAIDYYKSALKELKYNPLENWDTLETYAKAQHQLGNLLTEVGSQTKDIRVLEEAISCYKAALQVRIRDKFPIQWARSQVSLGSSYLRYYELTRKADCLKLAETCFIQALEECSPELLPENWAIIQYSLGLVYQDLSHNDLDKNLDLSLECLQNALQVFTQDIYPETWARIQDALGGSYYCKYLGSKQITYLEEAFTYFSNALGVFSASSFPEQCLRTGSKVGNLAFILGEWNEAVYGYSAAIDAVEKLRSWATSDYRRQEIVAEAIDVYEKMVQACINTGQLDKAIETVERSRSKRLVDLMASNDLYSGGEIPPEVQELLQQYEALQKQIDYERFGNNSGSNRGFMETRSNAQNRAAFQAYNEAIHILEIQKDQVFQKIRRLDPVLAGEIQVSVPDFARMQKLIDRPTTAILSFYTTTDNTYIFILRQNQSTPDLHTCEGQGIETLQNWISQNWLQPYCNDKDAWQLQLGNFLAELAQRLQINNLISCYLQGIEELILVPHLLLHQIPLAALPIEDTEHSYLGEKFLIRYVPSCQVLEFCQEWENRHPIRDSLNYGIVADATEDLACASFEAEQIAHLFNIPESQHLKGRSQATKSKYRQLASQVQLLHSCHHAESRLDKPLESILKLGDGTLTLAELLTPGWRLPNLSDVFLSCCETNLGVPESLADEILTLSTGFLCAGARRIISTLWFVDDLATALFSILYYQHRQEGKNRPEALQQAQKKLRSLTQEDIKSLCQKVQIKRQEARKQRKQHPPGSADYLKWDGEYRKYAGVTLQIEKVKTSSNDEPFSHPRYWAAFTCSGLR